MRTRYVVIDGKKYDRQMLAVAEAVSAGPGDGRISLLDAQRLLLEVLDSGRYTELEKKTMAYIRDRYRFTAEADAWFRQQIRRFAAG